MPPFMTEMTRYSSWELEMALAARVGSASMTGRKTLRAQDSWQTMLHSRGLTLMLRKPCWSSAVRPSCSRLGGEVASLRHWVWGRRTRMMGWRTEG